MSTIKGTPFGALLKQYRYLSGFSQTDLAKALENHQPVISNYERGRAIPTKDEILAIAKVLNLNEGQTNELLTSADFTPITKDIEIEATNVYNVYGLSSNPSYRELNIQIQDIRDSIASLGEHLEKSDTQNSSQNNPSSQELRSQIRDLQTSISELQATSQEITAPVALPSKQQLEVRLIPTTSFERLEEYRAEENKWFTWAGVFLGAVIGVFINLITGGEATVTTWIVSGTFLAMVIFSGVSARSYSQRAKNLRDEIVDKKPISNQNSKEDKES